MSAMDFAGMDPNKTPSGPPPPGVIPNFIDPPTNAHIAFIVTTVMLPLTLAFVSLRVYSNLWISHKFAKSDYTCIIATLASISFSAVLYWTISQHTFGLHIWDVPISRNSNSSIQNYMVLSIFYGSTIFLAKLSILLLYLEIFAIKKQARITVTIGLTIIAAQCLATIIGNSVLCVPKPGESWLRHTSTYKCKVTATLFGVFMGAVSVFSDIYVIYIPLPLIWQLHLATRKKVGVSLIFITGLFALVASIIALIYRIRQYTEQDNTWYGGYTFMLNVVEINVSIICSCMPSYASLLRHHLPTLQNLRYRLRSKLYGPHKQYSSTSELNNFERVDSDLKADQLNLTLGSAVRGGKFLQTQQREWPLMIIEEGGRQRENTSDRVCREGGMEGSIA
ncbi:hypothetical protein N7G274_002421 [Stereocaulon virgatum]|uniref:Rhodopsin domain-containing protein n=1 Tax=Stereocaulon virgatum TaxID=373712 RepID=A0ABR4APJ1_9LECA